MDRAGRRATACAADSGSATTTAAVTAAAAVAAPAAAAAQASTSQLDRHLRLLLGHAGWRQLDECLQRTKLQHCSWRGLLVVTCQLSVRSVFSTYSSSMLPRDIRVPHPACYLNKWVLCCVRICHVCMVGPLTGAVVDNTLHHIRMPGSSRTLGSIHSDGRPAPAPGI
jgi:hypothetical protein